MIDRKPDYHGEAKLWTCLESFLPDNVVVYNNREVNGREFDFCLFIENYGILVIEVKGWLSNKITVKGNDEIIVEGYEKPQRSPKKQSRAYRFAILNKITEVHNVSPLVFDMVCYPFISREEYKENRLDIVSEEQFTIFKEELESQEQLFKKIIEAYNSSKTIPHAELTKSLILKLRRGWETNLPEEEQLVSTGTIRPYSLLSTYNNPIDSDTQLNIVKEYLAGVKRIIFIKDYDSYIKIVDLVNAIFEQRNIGVQGKSLQIGYNSGLEAGEKSTCAFNLEIYYVPQLERSCPDSMEIEEGKFNEIQKTQLQKLSKLTTFNIQQYFVEHAEPSKNVLVEAGAGTGKTFSMVSRVAFLCNKKTDPVSNFEEEIALVTFTNDAANNMKVRIKQMFVNYFVLTGDPKFLKFVEETDRAYISTIHSFALDVIRKSSLYTGLGSKFRISSNEYLRGRLYDQYLSQFLEKKESDNANFVNELPVPVYDLKKKIIGVADKLLNKSVDLSSIKLSEMGIPIENSLPFFNEMIENIIIPSENDYLNSIHSNNDIDLKECIILLNKILNDHEGKIQNLQIRYLFIDEFQDTDDVQISVFQKLQKKMKSECKLFIVGDLKQSIYRFRGARLSAFKQLQRDSMYGWQSFHLNINYRTDAKLLDIYDDVFRGMGANNYLPYTANDRLTSNVITDVDEQDVFVKVDCKVKDEDKFIDTFLDILQTQESLLRKQLIIKKLSKAERTIAILVRNNWQVEKLTEAARKKGVRINTKSGGDLFQLECTLDLYKLVLALSSNSLPVYLVNFIESNYIKVKLDYQYYHCENINSIRNDLERILDRFMTARIGKTWRDIINEAHTQPILYVLKNVYEALQPWKNYSDKNQEQKYYMANYEYLIERIIKYSRIDSMTLNQVLNYLKINILTRQQQLAREIDLDDGDIQYFCTTIHKSKGLEYATVILPYTNDDIGDIKKVKLEANYSESKLSYIVTFDNKIKEYNSNYDELVEINEQISEEARVLYVALTRAIRNCIWINDIDSNAKISWGTLLEA